jgi:hypothetical protein
MNRRMAYSALALVAVALVAGLLIEGHKISVVATTTSSDVTMTTTIASASEPTSGFYLDIGASASLGMQPNGIIGRDGHDTDMGYANDVVTMEAAKGVSLALRQIGCPGETAQSMVGHIADGCYQAPATQMSTAVSLLRANHGEVGLVTIDLGFNNVRPCLTVKLIDETCANNGIALVAKYLPVVLRTLKAAAGTRVHFVGLDYNDPYLAFYMKGAAGAADATKTLAAMTLLNNVLKNDYAAASIPVANVPGIFQDDSTSPTKLSGLGTVPENVAKVCELTWMCKKSPWGPDDHPNNAGYRLIAVAIAAQLPSKW